MLLSTRQKGGIGGHLCAEKPAKNRTFQCYTK